MVCSALILTTVALTPSIISHSFSFYRLSSFVPLTPAYFQQGFQVPPQPSVLSLPGPHFHPVCLPGGRTSSLPVVSPSISFLVPPSLMLFSGILGFPLMLGAPRSFPNDFDVVLSNLDSLSDAACRSPPYMVLAVDLVTTWDPLSLSVVALTSSLSAHLSVSAAGGSQSALEAVEHAASPLSAALSPSLSSLKKKCLASTPSKTMA